MVTKNLGNGAFFLQCIAAIAGFFWKAIEKVQCCSIWIHSLELGAMLKLWW